MRSREITKTKYQLPIWFKGDFLLTVAVFIWGVNFIFVSDAMKSWNGFTFSFLACRFWLASAILCPIMLYRFRSRLSQLKQYIFPSFLVTLAVTATYGLQTASMIYVEPGKTAFVLALGIVFTPLGAILFFKEKLTKKLLICLSTCLIGLYLLYFHSTGGLSFGHILALISSLMLAIDVLLVAKYAKKLDPLAFTALQSVGVALICSFLALIIDIPKGVPSFTDEVLFGIGFTGILATALAFFLQTFAQKYVSPVKVAFLFSLEPVIASVFSGSFRGESFSLIEILGGMLILTGTLIYELPTIKIFSSRKLIDTDAIGRDFISI